MVQESSEQQSRFWWATFIICDILLDFQSSLWPCTVICVLPHQIPNCNHFQKYDLQFYNVFSPHSLYNYCISTKIWARLEQRSLSKYVIVVSKVITFECILLISDFHQIHQWAATRCKSWFEENLCWHHARLPGYFKHASVEANVVWSGILAHSGAGKEEVWSSWLEYSLWVQSVRFECQHTVCAKSFGWHGS